MNDISKAVSKSQKLSRDGMDIALPVRIAAERRVGMIKKILGSLGGNPKGFVRLTKFIIRWKPTCPPESLGTFAFEFYYNGGAYRHTILRGKGMIGHAVSITINTSIYIAKEQMGDCPYRVDISPGVESEGVYGAVTIEMMVSGPEDYPKNGIRNVDVSFDPPTRHGFPSIFYDLNPNGDQHFTNLQGIVSLLDDDREKYHNLITSLAKTQEPSMVDVMVFRYMINENERQRVDELEKSLSPGYNLSGDDIGLMISLNSRYSQSSHRKFAGEITGSLNVETATSTTRF